MSACEVRIYREDKSEAIPKSAPSMLKRKTKKKKRRGPKLRIGETVDDEGPILLYLSTLQQFVYVREEIITACQPKKPTDSSRRRNSTAQNGNREHLKNCLQTAKDASTTKEE